MKNLQEFYPDTKYPDPIYWQNQNYRLLMILIQKTFPRERPFDEFPGIAFG